MMGATTRAVGAANASDAQRSSLDYQASVAANNATLAGEKADIATQNGQAGAENQELKVAQTLGMQRAGLSANGVVLNGGSAANLLQSTQMVGQKDVDQIQTNALREAWGYNTQAADDTSNAKALTNMAGAISPATAALSSLVGSATQVAPAWVKLASSKSGNQQLGSD